MLHIKIYLRIWALQADVIASLHCSHQQRDKLIRALLGQMQSQQYYGILWHQTLEAQLRRILDKQLIHTEVREALHLFQATANHIAQNWDETWFSYAQEKYDTGEETTKTNPFNDPFTNWVNDQFNDDDDDPVPW